MFIKPDCWFFVREIVTGRFGLPSKLVLQLSCKEIPKASRYKVIFFVTL